MSQRERQASAGVSAAVASLPRDSSLVSPPALAGLAVENGPRHPPSWDELYRSAPPGQQAELLALARQQGLLYAHQLPSVPKSAAPATQAGLPLVTRLLGGQAADLDPVRPDPIVLVEEGLDAIQCDAVARGLATPDVCLIQGLPGSGKSRVTAEIVMLAATRGERVLFLAPSAAALDRVLERIAGRDAVYAFRCLGRDEQPEALAPTVRALTGADRARQLHEDCLAGAVRARTQSEECCERRRQEEVVWPSLLDFADNLQRLQGQLHAVTTQRAAVLEDVRREAAQALSADAPATPAPASFLTGLTCAARTHQEACAKLENARKAVEHERDKQQQELVGLDAQIAEVQPLASAKEAGRWWSLAWWKASVAGDAVATLTVRQEEYRKAAEALDALMKERDSLATQQQEADQAFTAEQARLEQAESARRHSDLADQEAALRHEAGLLEAKWQQVCAQLSQDDLRPQSQTLPAVETAHALWQARRAHDAETCRFNQDWAAYLQDTGKSLAKRLTEYVNVVAATTTALPLDEYFGEASGAAFDLLVLEEADQVTESEFLRAARRARRCVLVGEPAWEAAFETPIRPPSKMRPGTGAPTVLRPGFFHRLWERLHADPNRLPYTWAREGDKLCCRLRPVAADQRRWLESESVADSPDIELRILSLPRSTPVLAEVVFPSTTTIQQAKSFIYTELQELPVQSPGRSLRWVEEPGRLILRLSGQDESDLSPVMLEQGICEQVGCLSGEQAQMGWHTCRMEFDTALGWQRERAEEWIARHLNLRDLGRTALLEVAHRMTPPLAAVLSELLLEGADPVPTTAAAQAAGPAVEFVSVPSADRGNSRPSRGKPEPASTARPAAVGLPKAGAGLEVDLSSPRQPDRLPTELRALLPDCGLVNYLEAQALVRRLEELVADPALAGAASGPELSDPVVAVMALYPAQVELIRELMRRSPRLTSSTVPIEVDVPGAFRQRQCQVALVSLTRSHNHRAVPLGESPQLLQLALTRPRRQLVLFGDPGTLARRGQWQGALDHLDEPAATREGQFVLRLLKYLQGQARHPQAFRLWEGNGP